MTDAENRISIILINYVHGKYTLAELKDALKRGLDHLNERGVMGVDAKFIHNLAAIECAIKTIERQRVKES